MTNHHNKPTKAQLKQRIWVAQQEKAEKILTEHLNGLSEEERKVFDEAVQKHFEGNGND